MPVPKKIAKRIPYVPATAETIDFPLVSLANIDACTAAVEKASDTIEATLAQIACLKLESFFDNNSEVKSITFGGSFDYIDADLTEFCMEPRIAFTKKSGIDEDDDRYELEYEICGILRHWGARLNGETLKSTGGVDRLGKMLLDEVFYARWRSELEKIDIEAAARPAASSEAKAIRL